ncbi:dienelactone hydrolase family protein [Myxococcus fulvus]|uniref:dienelactone hydrolase family protein n=1 Tax=Myxococcus fulvus TaxID=33 RepID=UPI0020C13F51|nr:dienelactone hydrolase family protein [Myxococcus fulvus]MCK8496932.1 dienelactone hydrolase family protein [Myxococcus fulvus]
MSHSFKTRAAPGARLSPRRQRGDTVMSGQQEAVLHGELVEYREGETVCEGYVTWDRREDRRRPCVLLAHAWDGLNAPIRAKAEEFAALGYVCFAVDVYGKGVRGGVADDNSRLMGPLMEDRALLRRRMVAGFEAALRHPLVDPERIVVIGYCFGGLCALDLARSAVPGLKAAVSFHGVLVPPRLGPQSSITARVLILHGWEDPTSSKEDVLAVARELTEAGADWQLHAHGHAMHAFTYPGLHNPEAGLQYHPDAARRTWAAMRAFLDEVFVGAERR